MTELGLYRVRVKCLANQVDLNVAAPDYRSAESKAIRQAAATFRDADISHFKVLSVEQNGSVVI